MRSGNVGNRETQLVNDFNSLLLREFQLMSSVLAAVRLPGRGDVVATARHIRLLLTMMSRLDRRQDDQIRPLLRARARSFGAVIEAMAAHHESLVEMITIITPDVQAWENHPTRQVARRLGGHLVELSELLRERFEFEEANVMPLLCEHVTMAEYEAVFEAAGPGIAGCDLRSSMILIGLLTESAGPQERRWRLQQMPPIPRALRKVVGNRMYASHIRAVRGLALNAAKPEGSCRCSNWPVSSNRRTRTCKAPAKSSGDAEQCRRAGAVAGVMSVGGGDVGDPGQA